MRKFTLPLARGHPRVRAGRPKRRATHCGACTYPARHVLSAAILHAVRPVPGLLSDRVRGSRVREISARVSDDAAGVPLHDDGAVLRAADEGAALYACSKPVWETHHVTQKYTVCRPVYETCMKEHRYCVMKPVLQCYEEPVHWTTYKTIQEQHM